MFACEYVDYDLIATYRLLSHPIRLEKIDRRETCLKVSTKVWLRQPWCQADFYDFFTFITVLCIVCVIPEFGQTKTTAIVSGHDGIDVFSFYDKFVNLYYYLCISDSA